MELPSALFGLSPQNFSQKSFLYFFLKNLALKNLTYIFSKTSFVNFRKGNILIFLERYMKKPGISRPRTIFRTLVYSEPETFRILPNIYDATFCKNSYLLQFLSSVLKIFS